MVKYLEKHEPSRLQLMELQRVRHDWAHMHKYFVSMHFSYKNEHLNKWVLNYKKKKKIKPQESDVACPMTHNQLMAKLEFVTGSPDSKSVPNPSCISSDQTIKGLNLTFYDGNHWGKWYFLYGCFLFSLPFRNLHKTKSSAWVYWKWEIESLNILARNCVYKWEKFTWASMHIIKEKLGYTMRSYCTSQRTICSILW